MRDFAEIWRAADKVVYSRTLDDVSTARTRLEREFDPDAVRELKAAAAATSASAAPSSPPRRSARAWSTSSSSSWRRGGRRRHAGAARRDEVDLDLRDERRFGNGTVYLRYTARS